ncbi:MAG: hypothetical protein FJX52_02920 [Alphaproteobacteria bacterium]|nr:hypothetical protein [Alphaproteobacteria bacterium]
MEVTPLVPSGRHYIESYGDGRFRVGGALHRGSILVFPDGCQTWPVAAVADITAESLASVSGRQPKIEILLIGCGRRMVMLAPAMRQSLRASGIVADAMGTGAACRTYNVLMSEGRMVAAALIAVE